jgi:hypothetical protein
MMADISDFPAVHWEEEVYYITDVDLDNKLYIEFGGGVAYFVSPRVSIFGDISIENMRFDGAQMELEELPEVDDAEIETNYNTFDFIFGVNIWFGESN